MAGRKERSFPERRRKPDEKGDDPFYDSTLIGSFSFSSCTLDFRKTPWESFLRENDGGAIQLLLPDIRWLLLRSC